MGGSVIPKRYLKTAFYIFPDKNTAEKSTPSGASGFFVRHTRNREAFWYAVTNDHALKNNGKYFPNPAIRFNVDEKAETIETNRFRWICNAEQDIAVMPLFDEEVYSNVEFVESHNFVEKNKIGNELVEMGGWWGYGLGDEVFMVSRLMNHDGKEVNYPSIRTGIISMFPCEITNQEFLIECRSIGGHSGAPVFGSIDSSPTTHRTRSLIKLLGINRGHAKAGDGRKKINTGMTFVVPAWRILEMINSPEVMMASKAIKERGAELEQSYRSLDSASADTQKTGQGAEIPVPTNKQFFGDLEKASRKKDK